MSFDALPIEILEYIFQFVNPSDLLICRQVSKSWCHAALIYHSKFCITIDSLKAFSIFEKSPFLVKHVILRNLTIGPDILTSWNHLATHIQILEIDTCDILEKPFVSLLLNCDNLNSLHIKRCEGLFISGTLLENKVSDEELKTALKNVKTLSFESTHYLSDVLFFRLISVLPPLTKFSIAGCLITFHPAIYKRFYPQNPKQSFSASILSFQIMHDHIINNCNNMKSLNFSRTNIDTRALELLLKTENLKLSELILNSCKQITRFGFKFIPQYQTSLESLDLSQAIQFDDQSLVEMGKSLKRLKYLDLNFCQLLTDDGIIALPQFANLRTLNLSSCNKITPQGFKDALGEGTLPHLANINLSYTSINDDTLTFLAKAYPNLKSLDLTFCPTISDKGLIALNTYCNKLETLILAWCLNITKYGIIGETIPERENYLTPLNSISNLKRLQHLDLCSLAKIEAVALEISIKFLELKFLNLTLSNDLDDECLAQIGLNNPSLETLLISQCKKITEKGLGNALIHMPRLRRLELQGCKYLGNQSLKLIHKFCPQLKFLDVSQCELISQLAIEEFELASRTFVHVNKH